MKLLFVFITFLISGQFAPAQGLENAPPQNQPPLLATFPPSPVEQSKPGTGKFVIFTREQVGTEWDFIASAWECIPSQPKTPITKRVDFCHSSWNASPLLDTLVADSSNRLQPRFVTLQVDNGDRDFRVNLYDINFRTWDMHCIWQGRRLSSFGMIGQSIYCHDDKDWLIIDAVSGNISKKTEFKPTGVENGFWLVEKPGETGRLWSYDLKSRKYIAAFRKVEQPQMGYSYSVLSDDGKKRAWIVASVPDGWRGGKIAGKLILQRDGETDDISFPVEMLATAGSGIPVIHNETNLTFSAEGNLQFRAWLGEETPKDRVWTIASKT